MFKCFQLLNNKLFVLVFKVFSIGENEFTEVCNLRVGKNLNLNFSSIDVAWSTIEGMQIFKIFLIFSRL